MKKRLWRIDKLVSIGIFIVIVAVLYAFKTPCIVASIIGTPCPACGMTRAWISVLKFDLASAFRYHSLFWTVPLIFAFFWFDGAIFKKAWVNIAIMVFIAVLFIARWAVVLAI